MKGLLLSILFLVSAAAFTSARPADLMKPKRPQAPSAPSDEVDPNDMNEHGEPKSPVKVARAVPSSDQRARDYRGTIVPHNSFMPPFDEYEEATGERTIKDSWKSGGTTDVHENFVRLTNDRQSKAGWIHNTEPLALHDFSIYVNFRISGAGQRLYGDGIAIWVTDMTEVDWRRGGDLFAGPKDFRGFVILLDTFKNAEMGSNHKDIMLYVNDGEDAIDVMSPAEGATANYRYFEGRDDFSVLDYSVLHIMYKGSTQKLTVMMDEKNTGDFKTAFEHKIDYLPQGWDNELFLSFSATTGQLADNHDLLSVRTLKAGGRLPRSSVEEDVNPREIQSLERQVQKQSGGAQIAKLMRLYRRDAEMRLNHLHHAIEHELSFIQDSLASAINKIKMAEKDDQNRIKELERKAEEVAKQLVEQHVEASVAAKVEDHVEDHLERKMSEHSVKMERQMKRKIDSVQKSQENIKNMIDTKVGELQANSGGTSWIALLIVVLGFGGVAFYLSRRVAQMEGKNHLP